MLQTVGPADPSPGALQTTELVALPWLHMIAVGAGSGLGTGVGAGVGSEATENTEL